MCGHVRVRGGGADTRCLRDDRRRVAGRRTSSYGRQRRAGDRTRRRCERRRARGRRGERLDGRGRRWRLCHRRDRDGVQPAERAVVRGERSEAGALLRSVVGQVDRASVVLRPAVVRHAPGDDAGVVSGSGPALHRRAPRRDGVRRERRGRVRRGSRDEHAEELSVRLRRRGVRRLVRARGKGVHGQR